MELIWIPISIFAALMQAVRTAAQKTLNQRMSNLGTTYVRSLMGLPILIAFLAIVLTSADSRVPEWNFNFLAYSLIGAVSQVVATALLIYLFTLRSFAVGTMLIRCDILMTALIGSVWFSETITTFGWAALFVVLTGILLLLAGKIGTQTLRREVDSATSVITDRATGVALSCALIFTMSYLSIREATLVIGDGGIMWRAAWTVVVVTTIQSVLLGMWLVFKEPGVFKQFWPNRRIIAFIGITSGLGSICWFCAFALQNAAYVRAVAQVEAIFTLTISWLYFRESINRVELIGIVTVVSGVLMFRIVGT